MSICIVELIMGKHIKCLLINYRYLGGYMRVNVKRVLLCFCMSILSFVLVGMIVSCATDSEDSISNNSDGDKTETDGDKTETDGDKTETDGDKTETDGDKTETDGDKTETGGDKRVVTKPMSTMM